MEDKYTELGFVHHYVTNRYGIRILFGTPGNDDWCIEIPAKLVKIDNHTYKSDKHLVMYCIREDTMLRMAEKYTNIARNIEKLKEGNV